MSEYSMDELVEFITESNIDVMDDRCLAIIAKLRAADKVVESAIHVIGNLALSDDPEFDALNKAIDDYEGKP